MGIEQDVVIRGHVRCSSRRRIARARLATAFAELALALTGRNRRATPCSLHRGNSAKLFIRNVR
jgi:hypothetical protein